MVMVGAEVTFGSLPVGFTAGAAAGASVFFVSVGLPAAAFWLSAPADAGLVAAAGCWLPPIAKLLLMGDPPLPTDATTEDIASTLALNV